MAKDKGSDRSTNENRRTAKSGRERAARVVHCDEHGRVLELSPHLQDVLERQLVRFREKFGREPGADDPVFFDPDADEPRAINENSLAGAITVAAYQAGVPEAQIYAMKKTGMMIVHGVNEHLFTQEDMAAWLAALQEFDSLN